jgi:hypothetical protein
MRRIAGGMSRTRLVPKITAYVDKPPCRYFRDNGEAKNGKPRKRILGESMRSTFLQMEILCAEYAALEPKQEEDLFSRVQLGVPLTPAEKLKASSGAWQSFAVEIERQFPRLVNRTFFILFYFIL